jgi:cystathionine beta-lyase
MAEAFTSCDEWLEATVKTLASNAEHLLSQLEVHLPSVKSHIPEAGYLAWLDITELPMSTPDIATKGKVALVPGPDMGGESYKNFARLNFGTSPEIISEGVSRIETALKNLG